MRTWEEIREDFPILKEKIHGKDLIYLDNAATTQLPQQVLDCFVEHYTKYNANVHRGIHYLSEQSTMHMEAVRDRLKAFCMQRLRERSSLLPERRILQIWWRRASCVMHCSRAMWCFPQSLSIMPTLLCGSRCVRNAEQTFV